MKDGARAIVDGVERLGALWVTRTVTDLIDAFGALDDATRAAAIADASTAGTRAAARVVAELRTLFSLAPEAQRTTPLEIVRSLRREATQVLQRAGVPEVVRDRFEIRAFPDDVYGIVPKAMADLGDADLGGALLAWGMGKARAIRERAGHGEEAES